MKERTKLVNCVECDGYGTYSEDLDQPAITPCPACNGSGEARQLMTEEEIEAEAFERAEEREEDRRVDAAIDDWRGA